MKYVLLDGSKMTSKETVHAYLASTMSFPDYYGNNLDALWDVLTTISEPVDITLINKKELMDHLNEYANALLALMQEASTVNDKVIFNIIDFDNQDDTEGETHARF